MNTSSDFGMLKFHAKWSEVTSLLETRGRLFAGSVFCVHGGQVGLVWPNAGAGEDSPTHSTHWLPHTEQPVFHAFPSRGIGVIQGVRRLQEVALCGRGYQLPQLSGGSSHRPDAGHG